MMKTAISLPNPLFEEGEKVAQHLGMSRSELYATALEAYLKRYRADYVTRQLNAVYDEETSEMDDIVQRLQALTLAQEVW